jgi:hypothetical protein
MVKIMSVCKARNEKVLSLAQSPYGRGLPSGKWVSQYTPLISILSHDALNCKEGCEQVPDFDFQQLPWEEDTT